MSETPYAIDSEKTVLGIMLMYPAKASAVLEGISADDFYDPDNRTTFNTIIELRKKDKIVDSTMVVSRLIEDGAIEKPLDPLGKHILDLSEYGVTSEAVDYHKGVVRAKSAARRVIQSCNEMILEARKVHADQTGDMLNKSRATLAQISTEYHGGTERGQRLVDGIKESFTRASQKPIEGDNSRFVDLGVAGIKAERKIVTIIAGRPSNGKTVTAESMVINAAQTGAECLIMNNEDSPDTLNDRRLANIGGIEHERIINQEMTYDDYNRGIVAITKAQNLPITTMSCRGKTVSWIWSKAAAHKERTGRLDLLVIDYFQLIKVKGKGVERYASYSDAVDDIASMTAELGCATILLSQLKRPKRDGKVVAPWIDELKETGSLEQVSKLVILVHYPAYYNEQNEETKPEDEIRLHLAKYSSGRTGVKWAKCSMPTMKVYNDTIENKPPSSSY